MARNNSKLGKKTPGDKKTSPLVASVLQATLEKIKNAQEYNNPQTKNNVLQNASFFLSVLGLYISSPSFSQNPPQNMEELIEGLNSLNPPNRFLNVDDTFTHRGKLLKISVIEPPNNPPDKSDKEKGLFVSGINLWDVIPPKGFSITPGRYFFSLTNLSLDDIFN